VGLSVLPKYKKLGLPKYLQVKHSLKTDIERGLFEADAKLPAIQDMAKQFGVSYITMRQAIKTLEEDGLVKSISGRGTYITNPLPARSAPLVRRIKVVIAGELNRIGEYESELIHHIGAIMQEDSTEVVLVSSLKTPIIDTVDDDTDCYYIIAPLEDAVPELSEMAQSGHKFVVIGASWEGEQPFFCVDSSNYDAAVQAVEYLWESGHRKIGFIGDLRFKAKNITDRYNGFCDAMHNLGVTDFAKWSMDCRDNTEPINMGDQHNSILRLLSSSNRPTAVFSPSIYLVASIYEISRNLGIRIPEDLSIIGFDDYKSTALLNPLLTTFRQPLARMVKTARDYTHEMIMQNTIRTDSILIPCTFIERASVKPVSLQP
jgi:GntR family transcriptional regulator of arabinose operon